MTALSSHRLTNEMLQEALEEFNLLTKRPYGIRSKTSELFGKCFFLTYIDDEVRRRPVTKTEAVFRTKRELYEFIRGATFSRQQSLLDRSESIFWNRG